MEAKNNIPNSPSFFNRLGSSLVSPEVHKRVLLVTTLALAALFLGTILLHQAQVNQILTIVALKPLLAKLTLDNLMALAVGSGFLLLSAGLLRYAIYNEPPKQASALVRSVNPKASTQKLDTKDVPSGGNSSKGGNSTSGNSDSQTVSTGALQKDDPRDKGKQKLLVEDVDSDD